MEPWNKVCLLFVAEPLVEAQKWVISVVQAGAIDGLHLGDQQKENRDLVFVSEN